MADRPSSTASGTPASAGTISGNRGLMIEEPLIFEQGMGGRTAVDLPEVPKHKDRLGGLKRQNQIGLPGLSEPQVVRHYTRLSQMNFSIDTTSPLMPLTCASRYWIWPRQSQPRRSELVSLPKPYSPTSKMFCRAWP